MDGRQWESRWHGGSHLVVLDKASRDGWLFGVFTEAPVRCLVASLDAKDLRGLARFLAAQLADLEARR